MLQRSSARLSAQHLALALLPACCLALPAQALTLDFGNGPSAPALCSSTIDGLGSAQTCGNGQGVLQTYGDVAGVVDVSYTDVLSPAESLRWWDGNYNNLYGVLWASGSDAASHARIELRASDPTAVVTLSSLDLGAYSNTTRNTALVVYTLGGGTPLFSYTGAVGQQPANLATTFTPEVSAVGGLWIEWRDSAYNVGIDNIQFSVSVVPEPAAFWLMLAGVAGLALRRRG